MYYPITFQRLLSIFLQKVPVLSKLVSPVYGLNSRHNREKYIKMGIDFFSKYDAIYTTRLHGLILAILMNKKIYLLDNNYGKIKNFYNTWLKDFEGITILNGGGF